MLSSNITYLRQILLLQIYLDPSAAESCCMVTVAHARTHTSCAGGLQFSTPLQRCRAAAPHPPAADAPYVTINNWVSQSKHRLLERWQLVETAIIYQTQPI